MKLKCVIVLVLVLLCLSGTEGQRNRKNNRNNKNNNKKGNNNNSRNNSNNNNATPPPPPPPPPVPTVSEVSLLRAELMKLQNVILSQQLALATAAAVTQAPVTEAPKPKTKKTKPPKPITTPMPSTTTAIPPPVAPETVADVTGLSQPPPVSADPPVDQVPAEAVPGAPIEQNQAPMDLLAEPQVETATKSLASSLSEIIAVLENAPAVPSPGEILAAEAQNAIDPTVTQGAAPELVPVEPSTKPPKKMKTTTTTSTTTMEPTTTTTTTPAPPKPEPCPKGADISPCECTQATLPELLPTLDCSRVASLGDLNRMAGRKVESRLFKRIVLQNTPLSSLPRNAFGPHKAEEFWITNNFRLTRIDRGAFGSANPASLVLNNNALVNFPWQDLRSFSNLKYFIAYENQLSSIPDRAFSGLGPKIVDILLHNNSIQNVGEFPFSRLPALNAITLHNNLISELQSNAMHFDASPNILTLQNNFIKSVETDTFGRVAPLYTNLANNLIESLDREVWFQYLVNVAAAAGRNPGKSVAVDMTGNPILCEKCENFWLWQNKRRFERTVTGLTCIDAFSAPTFFELDRLFFRQCF